MITNIKNKNDIVIDFIGMNYLQELHNIISILNSNTETFLNELMETDSLRLYNTMIDSGFTEINYNKIELTYEEIEILVTKYNVSPDVLLLIKNNEEHDIEFYHETLQYSTESYIENELIKFLKLSKELSISYLDLAQLFYFSQGINVIECLFNIALINEYQIDLIEILEFKKKYPQKTGEYYVVWNNDMNLPGVNTILTPIYKYYQRNDGAPDVWVKIKYEIEYNLVQFKYNEDVLSPAVFQVYTQEFFDIIKDRIKEINYTVSQVQSKYKNQLENKSIKILANQIDKYLKDRVLEISNNLANCSGLEELKYKLNKVPLFCFQNDNLILEKMEYVQYAVNKLIKEYNAISSS